MSLSRKRPWTPASRSGQSSLTVRGDTILFRPLLSPECPSEPRPVTQSSLRVGTPLSLPYLTLAPSGRQSSRRSLAPNGNGFGNRCDCLMSDANLHPQAPSIVSCLTFEDSLHPLGGLTLKLRHDVAISVHRQCDLRMA